MYARVLLTESIARMCLDPFELFSKQLDQELESICKSFPKKEVGFCAMRRTDLWSTFHARQGALSCGLISVRSSAWSVLKTSSVSEWYTVWKNFIDSPGNASHTSCQVVSLIKDEFNAMQYACGFVPPMSLKKYRKSSGAKYT